MVSIAIDGPSGSGKSTFAKKIAEKMGCVYVDTGALYRGVGLAVLLAGKNTKNPQEVEEVLAGINIEINHINGEQRLMLCGQDVSGKIRTEEVGMAASDVSAHGATRQFLLETQRSMARKHSVVMDGRDIGTVVLPGADVKIFLTASVEARATRRFNQLLQGGSQPDYNKVKQDVVQRDYNDTNRKQAPLKKAEDAIEINTTNYTLEESFGLLLAAIEEKMAKDGKRPE